MYNKKRQCHSVVAGHRRGPLRNKIRNPSEDIHHGRSNRSKQTFEVEAANSRPNN